MAYVCKSGQDQVAFEMNDISHQGLELVLFNSISRSGIELRLLFCIFVQLHAVLARVT
jgi:hypothetical protein